MFDHKSRYVFLLAIFPMPSVIGMEGTFTWNEDHFSLKPDGKLTDLGEISETSDRIFKQSGIHSQEEQKSIILKSYQNFQDSIEQFDWDRRIEAPKAGEEDLDLVHHSKEDRIKNRLKTLNNEVKNKVKQHLYNNPGKLKADALKRKKGYIVFEDGENDDYLQNIIAYLYDRRIPEMIIIHGGNAELRFKMTEWVWKKIHAIADCEIPEILLGEQGEEEMSVFDLVEGIGAIDEHKRKSLLHSPMDPKTRNEHAERTYEKVANYISQLDRVLIGLKTSPTDLAEVIKRVGVDQSREKMFIIWATPGEFNIQDQKLELLASFNFYRNFAASDEVLKSGIKMVMIGNDLYNTHMIGMIDVEHAAMMSTRDPRYKTFKGFKGFTDLVKRARPDTFFHLYRGVQDGFQRLQMSYGERMLNYVIKPTREWLNKLKEDPKLITSLKITRPDPEFQDDQLITRTKIVEMLNGYEKKLIPIPAHSSVNFGSEDKEVDGLNTSKKEEMHLKRIEEISKSVDDLESQVMPLTFRWESIAKKPYFLEGCTADPHLEFVLNANLRQSSLKELIPVRLERTNHDRPHLIDMKVEQNSNCWIFTKLDSTKFVEMHQDLINWFRNPDKSPLPWTTFQYNKNFSS